ncbi:MAG TPA: hypothetical protein PLV45_00505 [bacterium]|nr:hypothetical protein [bacterium]
MGNAVLMKKLFEELIREEERGYRFFSEAARFVTNSHAVTLLKTLAQEEKRHIEVIESFRTLTLETVGANMESIRRSSAEVIQYDGRDTLVFVVDGVDVSDMDLPHLNLFKANEFHELLQQISLKTILKYAMRIEYENAQYIVEFMKLIRNKRHLNALKKLAAEEKDHFIRLKKLYDTLPASTR